MEVKYQIAWHTPDKYLNAVREVMGGIDLDPATDEKAQLRIKAKTYYTYETNGLNKKWEGSVILCPPYRQDILEQFVEKAICEYQSGSAEQIIVLIHTKATWEKWFQDLLRVCSAVCFIGELIKWIPGHEIPYIISEVIKPEYDERGSVFFYLGPNIERFIEVFSKFGVTR